MTSTSVFQRLGLNGRAFAALACLCVCLLVCVANLRAQDDDLFNDLLGDEAKPAAVAPVAENAAAPGEAVPSDASNESESTPKNDNYLAWMFRSLGWFFTLDFSLLSLTMVALVVMNIVSLRRSVLVPEDLTRRFGELLDDSKFQDAYELVKDDESLIGKVLSNGLARLPNGYDKATQAMQDVEQEETMRLEHQLGYLALIGNLAPMIGLFGTVVGMIASFQAIASGGAAPSPQKLAEGIATALFTTEIGLAIALPAIAAFDILKNRLARFVLDVSVVSDAFMSRFSNVAPQNSSAR